MSDVVNKVKKIKCPFKVAWQKQQLPGKIFEVATNKSLESRIAANGNSKLTVHAFLVV